MTPYQMYQAVARVVGPVNVDGAQKFRNVWRVYTMNKKARTELVVCKEIIISGKKVRVYDANTSAPRAGLKKNDKITHVNFSIVSLLSSDFVSS